MQPPEHEQPSSSSAAPPADAGGAWRRTHARHEQQQQQRVPRSRVVRIKVISMGDVGAGKSCLIKRCACGCLCASRSTAGGCAR
jgi:hypothetical protein